MNARNASLALMLIVGPATLAAGPPPPPNGGGIETRDFRIETDQTNSNLNNGDFSMPHRVKFFRPGTDVVGDNAKGNYKAGTVTISGHVVLHDNGQSAEGQKAGAPPNGGPATLECDQLQVDSKRKVYVATGNVHFVQGQRTATAQNGRLDQGAHMLDLSGDVHLADGPNTMSAETVHYDTLTKDVNTTGSPVIMKQPAAANGVGAGASDHSTLPTPPPKPSPKPKPKPKS